MREIWHKAPVDVPEAKDREQRGDVRLGSEPMDCLCCAVGYGEASGLNHVTEIIDLVREKQALGEL